MKKFQFKLTAVLRLRLHEEQEAQRELAELQQQADGLKGHLRTMQGHLEETRLEQREAVSGRVDLVAMRGAAKSAMQIARRADEIVRALAQFQPRLETARQNLVEKTRARRAIELLKERRYEEWKNEAEREEQATIDELANSRNQFQAACQLQKDEA